MAGKALVLLSGGLDSATCLYWAKQKFAQVTAITFNYSGRLERERLAAAKLADSAAVSELIEVGLPFVKEISEALGGSKAPANAPASYIPARNMMFYSIAAYHAELMGAGSIIGGHNLHDVELFKDASREYFKDMSALFRRGCLLCNGRKYGIVTPLAKLTRADVVRLALRLKVPISLTWSCHNDGAVHCGKCYACVQRIGAFKSLGMADPAFSA